MIHTHTYTGNGIGMGPIPGIFPHNIPGIGIGKAAILILDHPDSRPYTYATYNTDSAEISLSILIPKMALVLV